MKITLQIPDNYKVIKLSLMHLNIWGLNQNQLRKLSFIYASSFSFQTSDPSSNRSRNQNPAHFNSYISRKIVLFPCVLSSKSSKVRHPGSVLIRRFYWFPWLFLMQRRLWRVVFKVQPSLPAEKSIFGEGLN